MTARNAVADGRVPNELLGQMHRKMHEIVRRTDEGTLDPRNVINGLQEVVEGPKLTVDLSVCRLPLEGAQLETHHGFGVAKLKLRGDDLYLEGKRINLFRSKEQLFNQSVHGYHIREEVETRGGNLNGAVLDHLIKYPELWPQNWKSKRFGSKMYVLFWGDMFRDSGGYHYVRMGCWEWGRVVEDLLWLSADFGLNCWAASTVPE